MSADPGGNVDGGGFELFDIDAILFKDCSAAPSTFTDADGSVELHGDWAQLPMGEEELYPVKAVGFRQADIDILSPADWYKATATAAYSSASTNHTFDLTNLSLSWSAIP